MMKKSLIIGIAIFLSVALYACDGKLEQSKTLNETDEPIITSATTQAPVDVQNDENSGEIATISEDAAFEILSNKISGILVDGMIVVCNGKDIENEKDCWKFAVGKNLTDKFTAEKHFAVMEDGSLYVFDIFEGDYILYVDESED